MTKSNAGFTLVEVLIAIVVLSVGALAMAGTSAAAIRMVGQGKRSTQATQMAVSRLETLRRISRSTLPACTALSNGTASGAHGMSEAWTVTGTGTTRAVQVIIRHREQRGMQADTVQTVLGCK